ncbi:hypothetical protein A3F29_04045 [Candidatus Roizmanbacteria bacterium RIFCSPHIGHO2_12_FULL_33_9]|uniref:DUF202 domain-containing protein n=1 Tax=Candidatus Roizmanbacteria bacterium RIFCSPHIGHO2_12_FULL_33_9 TaxID=1802045 RepID=A0A1F7HJY9_9BACT|nr:MAG: hypothetical protein A3F29_04045 [Candidatus Roizmanbacteria bacterium RIFCSPHIGHO2_12_FULL_33_9]
MKNETRTSNREERFYKRTGYGLAVLFEAVAGLGALKENYLIGSFFGIIGLVALGLGALSHRELNKRAHPQILKA